MHARVFRFVPFIAAAAVSACGSAQQGAPSLPVAPASRALATPPALVTRAFTAGKAPGFAANSSPYDITLGPDGAMWFTDAGTAAIGRIDSGGHVTEYTAGLRAKTKPFTIVAGPDGNLWFSDACGAVGRITTAGAITEFDTNHFSNKAGPASIVVGADGDLWVNAQGPPNLLIRATVDGKLTAYPVPARYNTDGSLAADKAGNLWMFAQVGSNGIMLERKAHGGFKPHRTGLVAAALPCCPNYAPRRITIGPDGNPWFTTLYWLSNTIPGAVIGRTPESGNTKLFKVDRSNFQDPPHPAYPSGIATLRDHVWFTGDDPFQVNGGLWRIDEDGTQIGYPIDYNPIQLAPDGSGNLWFTAEAFNNPAQIVEVVAPK